MSALYSSPDAYTDATLRFSSPITGRDIRPGSEIQPIDPAMATEPLWCFWCKQRVDQCSGIMALTMKCSEGAPVWVCIEQWGGADFVGEKAEEFNRLQVNAGGN